MEHSVSMRELPNLNPVCSSEKNCACYGFYLPAIIVGYVLSAGLHHNNFHT
jgi:hypothetical protein